MNNKIYVITTSFSSARIYKRISVINEVYDNVDLVYVKRDNENEKLASKIFEISNSVVSLGTIRDGEYLSRIFVYIKLIFHVVFKISKKDKIYVFGSDISFISLFRKGIIIEIGDVRTLNMSSLKGRIFSFLERNIYKRVGKLILTSPFHFDNYYKYFIAKEKVAFIYNKNVNTKMMNEIYDKFPTINTKQDKIKIGFIGALRYKLQIDMLLKFVEKYSDKFELIVYGSIHHPFPQNYFETIELDNVSYFGKFSNPDDLEKIYSQIHVNYVVYDAEQENVRISIPNKLYESILFRRPIICAKETYLEKEVQNRNIGCSVDSNFYDVFEKDMLSLTFDRVIDWSTKMQEIERDEIFNSTNEIKTIIANE